MCLGASHLANVHINCICLAGNLQKTGPHLWAVQILIKYLKFQSEFAIAR